MLINLTLLVISGIASTLAFLFRLKCKMLNNFDDPSISVYDKTFSVFNPYLGKRRVISGFLEVLPLLVLGCSGLVIVLFFWVFSTGLLLTTLIVVVSVNLLVVDGFSEVYQDASVFVVALRRRANFGIGDLRVLSGVKKALLRISNYYFGLAVIFCFSALIWQWIAPLFLLSFAQLIEFVFKGGLLMGVWPPYTVSLVWALVVVVATISVKRVYSKFLAHFYP
jgi:hypothetical protein